MSTDTRQSCGNSTGNVAAIGNEEWQSAATSYSIPEAARLLGISERTLRDRVSKGKILATRTERGYQIAAIALGALRQQERQEEQQPPATAGNIDQERQAVAAEIAALRKQLAGAHLAAKIAAHRMGQAHGTTARLEREREHLVAEVQFLRSLVDQLRADNSDNRRHPSLWEWIAAKMGLRRAESRF